MWGICIVLLLHEWEMPNFSYFHVIWHDMSDCCNLACRTNLSRMWQYPCGYSKVGTPTLIIIRHWNIGTFHAMIHYPHVNCLSNGSSRGLQSLLESFLGVKRPSDWKSFSLSNVLLCPSFQKTFKKPPQQAHYKSCSKLPSLYFVFLG
jgi:hypothetical protein